MHVYHYAPYEPAALKCLMGRYATRQEEIAQMLRAGLSVDLYQVVRRGVGAGVESYSIKRLEPFYGFEHQKALADANAALVWCLTNTLTNLRVLLAVGCVALPRVVTATARHRALPTTKMPSHLHKRICETPH